MAHWQGALTDGGLMFQIVVAFAIIGALALVLRWAFRGGPKDPPAIASAKPEDFGLLGTVAVVDTREGAYRLRARLGEVGIRATVTKTPEGRYRVLVFGSEVDRARRVGGWSA